ncbi:MAG: glycerate kinase, partial [Silicimonas sp.]|nr:glycerate kinase [Silicimonas sp.]
MNAADKEFLTNLFHAAVDAADPMKALRPHLPEKPKGRTIVIGAGKGAAQMAAAFETLWGEPVEGVVVTRYGYACATKNIQVMEASHPVPDAAGLKATEALFSAVADLTTDDLVVALICGGGSALLPAPPEGLTLEDEQSLNQALLTSGAPISAMNAIRKQVSRIKGGRLAQAALPARVVSLVVSDVPGDDPAQVASGPTVADETNRKTAMDMIALYGIDLTERLKSFLQEGPEDAPSEAIGTVRIVASASISLADAASLAHDHGIPAVILSDTIEGEARDIGMMHAAIAREVSLRNQPFSKPVVILSGGETTVAIGSNPGGKGGRNSEFLLSFAGGIEGQSITALAADTDGID